MRLGVQLRILSNKQDGNPVTRLRLKVTTEPAAMVLDIK